jgi:hypothetical protein
MFLHGVYKRYKRQDRRASTAVWRARRDLEIQDTYGTDRPSLSDQPLLLGRPERRTWWQEEQEPR